MLDVPEGQDPHSALRCRCCDGDHHHGENANTCLREHDEPCWTGPPRPKPPGCTVCRPVTFLGNITFVIPAALSGLN
jgi:hypothetical protein